MLFFSRDGERKRAQKQGEARAAVSWIHKKLSHEQSYTLHQDLAALWSILAWQSGAEKRHSAGVWKKPMPCHSHWVFLPRQRAPSDFRRQQKKRFTKSFSSHLNLHQFNAASKEHRLALQTLKSNFLNPDLSHSISLPSQ